MNANVIILTQNKIQKGQFLLPFFFICRKNLQWSHLTNIERFSERGNFLGHTDETLVNLAKRIPKDLNEDD